MTERFAIYYAPPPGTALADRAAAWLGRETAGWEFAPAETPDWPDAQREALTTAARRYGFHATLKAPMALAAGETREALEEALLDFASRHGSVDLGRLAVADLAGFLALVPEAASPALIEFAAEVVSAFEPFRAPLSAEDRARRTAAGLTPQQIGLLDHYGYPFVMDQFQFHMTLTDRLPAAEREAATVAARGWFAPVLEAPLVLDRISLFHEPEPGAPFRRLSDYLLAPGAGT